MAGVAAAGMIEIVNEIETPAARDQVWRVIEDLPNYRSWHPMTFFNGKAGLNAVVEYGFNGTVASVRDPSAPARIAEYQPGSALGWKFGIPALMWANEWYRLTPSGTSTCVEHGFRCSGPLSWVAQILATRRLDPMLERADAALTIHVGRMPKTAGLGGHPSQ